jgi:hypothetical protein
MIYPQICDILNQEGVRSLKDVERLKVGGSLSFDAENKKSYRLNFVTSDHYPWIRQIFELLEYVYESVIDEHRNLGSQAIVVGEPYDNFYFHRWSITDEIFYARAKLACLFPKKLLILTQKAVFYAEEGTYWIPTDFLAHAVCLEPLIRLGYVSLLPKRLREESNAIWVGANLKTSYYYIKDSAFISVPGSGVGWKDLQAHGSGSERKFDCILNLPWLGTSDIRHSVDVMQKYPDEFKFYSDSMTKALSCREPDVLEKWIHDVVDASDRLDLIYKNKMKELTAKGWETFAGMIPSMLALAIPELPAKEVLVPLIAGKSGGDAVRWLYDFRHAKDLLSSERHWIMWRMKF